jgi:hypothetical protein
MEKIQEQAGEIDKEREKCQNVRREFKGAEEEHNRVHGIFLLHL